MLEMQQQETFNPESASGKAILAVQNAQNQPLTDQLIKLKSFIEDIARIWFELLEINSRVIKSRSRRKHMY